MRTRIFRALVCLVLVLSLLVQVSPIKAKAADNNFFYIDPQLQLASDLIGLGVSTGADSLAHTEVIQEAADWLAETGEWLTDGMLKVYKVAAAAGGFKYMVDGDFLQELFEWLWDVEVVSGGPCSKYTSLTLPLSPIGSNVTFTSDVPFAMFAYSLRISSVRSDPCFVFVSTSWNSIVSDNGQSFAMHKQYGSAIVSGWVSSQEFWSTSPWGLPYLGVFDSSEDAFVAAASAWSGSDITTDKDLTLNYVGAFGSIVPDAYPEWFQNSTTITDTETGEEKTVVPIGLGQTVTETQGMSQAGIWAGTSTYVDTETDVGTGDDTITVPETVTLKDILTGILSVPKSIAQAVAAFFADVVAAVKAIPAAITEFFTISADVSAFAIEWRDFFPFCIPFDIYDFLTLLMADPEAPKFEWEIDLLKTGEPYLMVVDLSEWDDVAQLLRRLELLAFIVGLAMVTREKYIRG